MSLAGELDRTTVDRVSRVLKAPPVGCERVVLILREVTFLDVGALRLMLDTRDTLAVRGIAFLIAEGPAPVMQTIRLAAANDGLVFADGWVPGA